MNEWMNERGKEMEREGVGKRKNEKGRERVFALLFDEGSGY